MRGERSRRRIEEVEQALQDAALWEEVKDRLHQPAYNLSGGQQQRLPASRALATDPELLLFDEPTSALDPIATASIEELMHDLKERVTILIVTHNMQQAARVSDFTAYMYLGDLIEFGVTDELFIKPKMKQTEDYIPADSASHGMTEHASAVRPRSRLDPLARARHGRAGGVADPARDRCAHDRQRRAFGG